MTGALHHIQLPGSSGFDAVGAAPSAATEESSSPVARSCRSALAGSVALAITDRKSTRLNSSHMSISYAVFCLKKKNSTKASECTKKNSANNKKPRIAGLFKFREAVQMCCLFVSARIQPQGFLQTPHRCRGHQT